MVIQLLLVLGEPQLPGQGFRRPQLRGVCRAPEARRRRHRTLPGLGRLPAAGAGLALRGHRRPLQPHSAALPDRGRQPLHRARLRALHPLRPLRAGLQRGAGQPGDPLRLPRRQAARSSPPATGPTATRTASSAASASRPARPGRWWKRTSATRCGPGRPARCAPPAPTAGWAASTELHVKDNRVVKVTGVEDAAPNYGSLCVKGRFGFDFIGSPERLTQPLDPRKRRLPRGLLGRGARAWWPAAWARSRPPPAPTASGS